MQQRLSDLGYPVGEVDGAYGKDTQIALGLFCGQVGLDEHKYLSSAAEKKLYADDAPYYDQFRPLKKGMEGTAVYLMQEQLALLGCHTGALDGIYGPNTVSGVAQFQTASGLYPEEDEEPGEIASRELLMLLYAVDAPTLKPMPKVRWEQVAGGWTCYLNGVLATGWVKIDDDWYYFSADGIMQTGWLKDEGDTYYIGDDGIVKTSWQKIGGSWYYFNTAGIMQRGWLEDKRAEKQKRKGSEPMWYWLDADGRMVTGEHVIDGKTEVFDSTGLWLYTK